MSQEILSLRVPGSGSQCREGERERPCHHLRVSLRFLTCAPHMHSTVTVFFTCIDSHGRDGGGGAGGCIFAQTVWYLDFTNRFL